jgi:hypothetical protein
MSIARRLGPCAALAVVAALSACSLGDDFDRGQAVRDAMDESGTNLTREQAECYVDRVRDEIGPGPLRPGGTVPEAQMSRVAAIRVDCVGVSNLGAGDLRATPPSGSDDTRVIGPYSFGDDPVLDALWDACAAGEGARCDELFDQAPLGSDYERFAARCGDRTRELRCADVYPSPGVTLPSPAQPSTTVPPASP